MPYNLQSSYPNVDALESKDKALSVLYGRTSTGPLVPISVDDSGRLRLGSSMTLETDLGEVTIKGTTDAAQTIEERIGVRQATGLAAGRFAVLVEDPRTTFDGSNNLNVRIASGSLAGPTDVDDGSVAAGQTPSLHIDLGYGFDGTAWERIRSEDNAELQLSQDKLFATDNFTTADGPTFVQARPTEGDLLVRHYKSKTISILNTGANDAQYTVAGSVDGGTNYDITIVGDALISSGQTVVIDENRVMTHVRITAHSTVAGQPTNIRTRAYAMGV